MPASLVPWAHQALQDFLEGKVVKETWGSLGGLEKKVTWVLLVPKDLQGQQENLVPQDHLAAKEKKVTWLYQELKGTKEKEVLMGPQDFQGSRDSMVEMGTLEKRGTQDPRGIMKMQPQVTKGLLDHQAPRAEQDLGGLQDWDFLVHQERGGHQEHQAARARGDLMAERVRKVILFLVT